MMGSNPIEADTTSTQTFGPLDNRDVQLAGSWFCAVYPRVLHFQNTIGPIFRQAVKALCRLHAFRLSDGVFHVVSVGV